MLFINANLVGRGTWNDLKSLRHTITKEWDFENLEVKQSLEVEEKYIGLDDIRKEQDQYQIKEAIENHNEITKTKNIEVIVEKKESPALIESTLFDENKNEKEAKSFIKEFAGMFDNTFHPTKTAKEMKRELLDQDS